MSELKKDKLFILKTDLITFREISANITDDKINGFIREAQIVEVRGFLGMVLYQLLQADFDEGVPEFPNVDYNLLWYGGDYVNLKGDVISFNGYGTALAYFTYSRFMLQQQHNVSRYGIESVQNEISQDITSAQIRTKTKESLSMAIQYQQDTKLFLEASTAKFPEYVPSETKPKNTSFTFTKL